MKRIVLFIAAAMVCFAAYAQQPAAAKGKKILVAYFSATGTTEKAARLVAEVAGGMLYRIRPEKAYTADDLNWHNESSRSSVETADPESRPALIADLKNPSDYDIVYLGFPIWWNRAPKIIATFMERYDFAGKTVVPFATSGSSNISNAEKELQQAYPQVNWQKGKLLNGATLQDIRKWIKK